MVVAVAEGTVLPDPQLRRAAPLQAGVGHPVAGIADPEGFAVRDVSPLDGEPGGVGPAPGNLDDDRPAAGLDGDGAGEVVDGHRRPGQLEPLGLLGRERGDGESECEG